MRPFSWLAKRVRVGRGVLRAVSSASLVASILIVVGGGVVRVTGSGLGCPDWPTCTVGSLAPTPAMGWQGVVEFANRLLTGVLCLVVGWTIVAARLQRRQDRAITRWAWIQMWIVVLNAVVGGITVLARLSPYMVAATFLPRPCSSRPPPSPGTRSNGSTPRQHGPTLALAGWATGSSLRRHYSSCSARS